jgi:hypothetical protein
LMRHPFSAEAEPQRLPRFIAIRQLWAQNDSSLNHKEIATIL